MRVARFPNHRLHVCQHETLTTFRYQSAEGITEMGAALLVANALPPSMGLFLGNSMPIRDVDALAGVRPGGQFLKGSRHTTTNVNFGPGAPVCANRGASGIDGVVSAAAGFAAGTQLPVTLVIGDVSFQHDANGLLLLRERPGQPPVTIVVVRVTAFPNHALTHCFTEAGDCCPYIAIYSYRKGALPPRIVRP